MDTATSKLSWYIFSTKPGMERKVVESLERRKIKSYCPVRIAGKTWSERRKHAPIVLFPGMVFVKTNIDAFSNIIDVEGITGLRYWLSQPAVVNQEEIDTIHRFLSEYDKVSVEKNAVNLSEKVRIVNGPLVMWEGNIVEVKTNTVKIALPSLGFNLVAEITTNDLELQRFANMSKAV